MHRVLVSAQLATSRASVESTLDVVLTRSHSNGILINYYVLLCIVH